jgi:hypothetical protein
VRPRARACGSPATRSRCSAGSRLGDAGLHPRSSSSTGRFRAGRPAGLRGRAARATRSCPGPARRTGRHGSRQAACRPWAPAAEHGTHGDWVTSRPSNGSRIGGRISPNRSASARSLSVGMCTTNVSVSRMASQNADVGSIRPSRRAGWPSATSTEETVRPAPVDGRPVVQTVTGATRRPRNRRAGSRRSGGVVNDAPCRCGWVGHRWSCQHCGHHPLTSSSRRRVPRTVRPPGTRPRSGRRLPPPRL